MKRISLTLFFLVSLLYCQAQDITGTWYGRLVQFDLRLVFHISEKDGSYQTLLDSPDQHSNGITTGSTTFDGTHLTIEIPKLKAQYKGDYANGEIKGTFTQHDLPFPLDLSRQETIRKRPQEPKPPFPYHTEDLTFENPAAGITLAGTLTLPQKEGKFPAVVLISGSGPQDRNEELMGHKPFLVIADYLTRQGIAVLRFDDRGFGKSGGQFSGATSQDFATDVQAAVNYLKTRKEIQSNRIGLVGHSEGGMIAPMVAANDSQIAFIVLLAGVGTKGHDLLVTQAITLTKAAGGGEEEIRTVGAVQREAGRIVIDYPVQEAASKLDSLYKKTFETSPGNESLTPEAKQKYIRQAIAKITDPWTRYFIAYDPAPVLAKVKCPVLALNGEKDLQVVAHENLEGIRNALQKSGNQKVKTVSFPGLNHLFQECKTGVIAEYAEIEQTFSPEVLKVMGDWIKEQTQKKK